MQTKYGEWWEYSWNVAPGCTPVSEECNNCWARAMAKRLQGMRKPGYEGLVDERGWWTGKVNRLAGRLQDPLRLKRPKVIAVNLMGDLFHRKVPFEFIDRVFMTMLQADWHTYMVLTKRPYRMMEFVMYEYPHYHFENIWLGTTAGTQQTADDRWGAMSGLALAGWNTWVSSEPRLEGIDWRGWEFLKRMITGGESGPYARPMAPAWPRADRDWCQANGIAFWFKQWGEWGPGNAECRMMNDECNYPMTTFGDEMVFKMGRKLTGRTLDGQTWEEEVKE